MDTSRLMPAMADFTPEMSAVGAPPPARSSKLVSGPGTPPWLQGMKTNGEGSSRSEPYFASFTTPTISIGPPAILQAYCDPRPSGMRKCLPEWIRRAEIFLREGFADDGHLKRSRRVVAVEIATCDDCRSESFKVPVAHIVEGGHRVIARFWSVAVDLHFTGPTAVTDRRDGGDAGRMHARNRAQLVQHLQVHGGPSLPRIISTAEIGADEQHLVALKSGIEGNELPKRREHQARAHN